jgi:hypothetical protein
MTYFPDEDFYRQLKAGDTVTLKEGVFLDLPRTLTIKKAPWQRWDDFYAAGYIWLFEAEETTYLGISCTSLDPDPEKTVRLNRERIQKAAEIIWEAEDGRFCDYMSQFDEEAREAGMFMPKHHPFHALPSWRQDILRAAAGEILEKLGELEKQIQEAKR